MGIWKQRRSRGSMNFGFVDIAQFAADFGKEAKVQVSLFQLREKIKFGTMFFLNLIHLTIICMSYCLPHEVS
jgi:hypothetical protein